MRVQTFLHEARDGGPHAINVFSQNASNAEARQTRAPVVQCSETLSRPNGDRCSVPHTLPSTPERFAAIAGTGLRCTTQYSSI